MHVLHYFLSIPAGPYYTDIYLMDFRGGSLGGYTPISQYYSGLSRGAMLRQCLPKGGPCGTCRGNPTLGLAYDAVQEGKIKKIDGTWPSGNFRPPDAAARLLGASWNSAEVSQFFFPLLAS